MKKESILFLVIGAIALLVVAGLFLFILKNQNQAQKNTVTNTFKTSAKKSAPDAVAGVVKKISDREITMTTSSGDKKISVSSTALIYVVGQSTYKRVSFESIKEGQKIQASFFSKIGGQMQAGAVYIISDTLIK